MATKFEGYLDDSKDVHTLAQSREFAHFAKDLNLYFEAEVEQEEPTKKAQIKFRSSHAQRTVQAFCDR